MAVPSPPWSLFEILSTGSTPRNFWSPIESASIGSIIPDFGCFGHARSTGQKCRNVIAIADRRAAKTLLLQISGFGSPSAIPQHMLQSLAGLILCKRWHSYQKPCDQSPYIVQQWLDEIWGLRAWTNIRVSDPSGFQGWINIRVPDHIPGFQGWINIRVPDHIPGFQGWMYGRVPDPVLISPRQERIVEGQQNGSSQRRDISANRMDPDPVPSNSRDIPQAVERQNESLQSTRSLSDPSPRQEASQEGEPRSESSRSTPSSSNGSNPRQETPEDGEPRSESSRSTPSSSNGSNPRQETPGQMEEPNESGRRRIVGDCPICIEDLNDGGSVLWCKAQCGQNFHQECINTWLDRDDNSTTCPYCRAAWID